MYKALGFILNTNKQTNKKGEREKKEEREPTRERTEREEEKGGKERERNHKAENLAEGKIPKQHAQDPRFNPLPGFNPRY
jgi:hypothetical protein